MSTSREFQSIADLVPDDFNIREDDYQVVRQKMAPWHGFPTAPDTTVEYSQESGVAVSWLNVADCTRTDRYALFCHGGGFVSCSMQEYLFFADLISGMLDCRVVTPDYRLAPENPYPAALEDCLSTYQAMLVKGIEPSKIYTIGDSCGASLAVGLLLKARDLGLPMPACHIGLTGWYDLALDEEITDQSPRKEPMITPGWFRNRVRDYLGNVSPTDPNVSPAYANCAGLPPGLLQYGSNDMCLAGGRKFAAAGKSADVKIEVQVSEGMIHGFHGLVRHDVPESYAAWQAARVFLDDCIPE